MGAPWNPPLMTGATLSAAAALLHVGCIVFGAPWYCFFGAGADAAFWAWSSGICLVFGIVHIVGLAQVWPRL